MEKYKLLVVDDEPSIRELLNEFLEGEGYLVKVAANGREALELVRNEDFHLVISDIRMPEIGGFELVTEVKNHNQKIGFILMTGFSTIYTEGNIRQGGADDYLSKPLDLSLLLEKIERVLFQMKLLTPRDG